MWMHYGYRYLFGTGMFKEINKNNTTVGSNARAIRKNILKRLISFTQVPGTKEHILNVFGPSHAHVYYVEPRFLSRPAALLQTNSMVH